jgi:hypothetical protein
MQRSSSDKARRLARAPPGADSPTRVDDDIHGNVREQQQHEQAREQLQRRPLVRSNQLVKPHQRLLPFRVRRRHDSRTDPRSETMPMAAASSTSATSAKYRTSPTISEHQSLRVHRLAATLPQFAEVQ